MDNKKEESAKLQSSIAKNKSNNKNPHNNHIINKKNVGLNNPLRQKSITSGLSNLAKNATSTAESVIDIDDDGEYQQRTSGSEVVSRIVNIGISKMGKWWLIIALGSSVTFFLLLIIASIFLVKNSDGLSYADQNYFANEEYKKLYNEVETVVSKYKVDYGVTVDKYLIIAALTAYQDNEEYMDSTTSGNYDFLTDENGSLTDETLMTKKVEILAKYQIKTTKNCSLDSSSMREIASNDDKSSILNFWQSEVEKEKNYDCSGSGDTYYTLSTEEGTLDDENSGSTFYWNMIDENFFEEYYPKYFSGLSEEAYETQAARALEYMYMYARSLRELECDGGSIVDVNFAAISNTCHYITVEPDADGNYAGTYELEEYVAGVIADEFPPSYMRTVANNEEAIKETTKAFAIVVRSYAVVATNGCSTSIANSSSRQNFKPTDDAMIWEAVNETSGLVLSYNDAIISTEYDSFNGECISKKNGVCNSRDFNCDGEFCRQTYIKKPSGSNHEVIIPDSWSGYAAGGHGRGMSQWGALYLGTTGMSYEEILKNFYADGSEIRKLQGSAAITSGSSSSYCNRKGNVGDGEGICDGTSYYGGKTIGQETLSSPMTLLACTAEQADLAFNEIYAACGTIPHAGSMRSFNAEVNAARSSTSFHYTGRAFDLNTEQGMRSNDTYFYVTLDDTSTSKHYYRIYCKAINDVDSEYVSDIRIVPLEWKNGRAISKTSTKGLFLDVTAVFNKYGIYGIGPRSCANDGNYMCTEWWHFQDTSGLVVGQTTFEQSLDQFHGLNYNYSRTPVSLHLNKKWNGGTYR